MAETARQEHSHSFSCNRVHCQTQTNVHSVQHTFVSKQDMSQDSQNKGALLITNCITNKCGGSPAYGQQSHTCNRWNCYKKSCKYKHQYSTQKLEDLLVLYQVEPEQATSGSDESFNVDRITLENIDNDINIDIEQ